MRLGVRHALQTRYNDSSYERAAKLESIEPIGFTRAAANSARVMGTRRRVRQRFVGKPIAAERMSAAVELKHLVTPND
jgi:hypothetical protein